jgi:WD40 repeat protein
MSGSTLRACSFLLLLLVPTQSALAQTAVAAGNTDAPKAARVDRFGDPLPPEALARFGTIRFRSESALGFAVLSPEGGVVAVDGYDQSVRLMDTTTGLVVRQFPPAQMTADSLAFSPDGAHLATTDRSGVIELHDLSSGRLVRTFTGDVRAQPSPPVFSANGRVIAGMHAEFTADHEICVWEVATGKLLAKCKDVRNCPVGAALSSDGKMLATWGAHNYAGVVLWDVQSGKEVPTFHMKEADGVCGVGFAPDGKSMAVALNSGYVALLNPADGKEIRRLGKQCPDIDSWATANFGQMPPGKSLVKFSPDGKKLAVAVGRVRVWDTTTGKPLSAESESYHNVSSLVITRDHVLAAATLENAVRVWDPITGTARGLAGAHANTVSSIALTADGRTLLSADVTGELCSWDTASGRQIRSTTMLPVAPPEPPRLDGYAATSLLAPRGKYAVLCAPVFLGDFRFRDIDTGRDLRHFPVAAWGRGAAGFSRDSDLVALGGESFDVAEGAGLGVLARTLLGGDPRKFAADKIKRTAVVVLCKTATGRVVRRFKGMQDMVQAVAVSPDGRLVAAFSESYDPFHAENSVGEICIWDAQTGKQLAKIPATPRTIGFGLVGPLVFSPDGTLLASGEEPGIVHLRNAATGQDLGTLGAGGDPKLAGYGVPNACALSFSPDGHVLAVGWSERQATEAHQRGKIQLWELSTASVRKEFTGNAGDVTALAWSADGQMLASGGADTTVLLWDVSGEKLRPRTRTRLNQQEAESLWRELGSASASRGYEAILRLASAPEDAVALLHRKLKPVVVPNEEEMKRLLKQLDSQRFPEREAAAARLEEAGKAVLPVLHGVLQSASSAELRQRAHRLIYQISRPHLATAGEAQSGRALEVLEAVNTPEAQALLKDLARGQDDARLTREAKAALVRASVAR